MSQTVRMRTHVHRLADTGRVLKLFWGGKRGRPALGVASVHFVAENLARAHFFINVCAAAPS